MVYEGKFIKEVEERIEPQVEKFLLFEENEAIIEYVCNDCVLKEGGIYNDVYGKMTCKKNAIENAKEIVINLKLKDNSDLIIQVKLRTYHIKKKDTNNKYEKYKIVGYPTTIKEEVVWSSNPSILTEKSEVKHG